jgi:hypothetical protein
MGANCRALVSWARLERNIYLRPPDLQPAIACSFRECGFISQESPLKCKLYAQSTALSLRTELGNSDLGWVAQSAPVTRSADSQPDHPASPSNFAQNSAFPFLTSILLLNGLLLDVAMHMGLVWKAADACKPRGRLIRAAEWDRHKDDIIRVYRSSNMNYLVEWMTSNRNFCAT